MKGEPTALDMLLEALNRLYNAIAYWITKEKVGE